ncbi:hypothetical protein O3M35_003270 [Rhynocoris fuscipes]|uniref:Transmembrane protein 242 n=1 Tax=Rhynocoris fuscipes TaxID=488301 RepID=A0AAW1CJJ9_9HEMI
MMTIITDASSNISTVPSNAQKQSSGNVSNVNDRLKAGLFLSGVTGIAALAGFSMTLASARRKDPKMFLRGSMMIDNDKETGVELAIRAFKWGTFYAISGCSLLWFSIWKWSGANTMEEFRYKMGSILPRVPKNEIPQGRTEFTGLTDLLNYISSERSKESTSPSDTS